METHGRVFVRSMSGKWVVFWPSSQWRSEPAHAPGLCGFSAGVTIADASSGAAVFLENSRPGNAGVLTQAHGTGISAYAVATSVDIQGIVSFAVSTVSSTYSIDLYRIA